MSIKVLSAGEHIASKCTKCKDTTNHTIVAMVGEKVVKVQCNTCGGAHNYRAEAKKKEPVARKTTAAKPRATTKIQKTWEELQEKANNEATVPYSMTTPMKIDMLIVHPTFGLGQIVNCIKPNKIEVQFQSDVKMLRCTLK